jgi:hypothetical protein
VFHGFEVNPKDISHLYMDGKTKIWYIIRYKYQKIFLVGGFGYLLLDVLNSGEANKETLLISATLVASGLLAKWLTGDTIKIKGRRRLLILG